MWIRCRSPVAANRSSPAGPRETNALLPSDELAAAPNDLHCLEVMHAEQFDRSASDHYIEGIEGLSLRVGGRRPSMRNSSSTMGGRSRLCLARHTLMLWTAVGLAFSQPISFTHGKTTLRLCPTPRLCPIPRLCQGRNQSASIGDETPICLRPKLSSQNRLLPFS